MPLLVYPATTLAVAAATAATAVVAVCDFWHCQCCRCLLLLLLLPPDAEVVLLLPHHFVVVAVVAVVSVIIIADVFVAAMPLTFLLGCDKYIPGSGSLWGANRATFPALYKALVGTPGKLGRKEKRDSRARVLRVPTSMKKIRRGAPKYDREGHPLLTQ